MTSQLLRIVMLIQGYHPLVGGAERQLGQLAPLLKQRGLDIHILTRRYAGLSKYEEIDGVPVHRLPIPGPKVMASLTYTVSALTLMHRLKPDVIHAHELLSPTTTAILARRLFGTPIMAKLLRGGALGDLARLRQKFNGQRRIDAIAKHVNAFVVISREIDRELVDLGISSDRRHFIPNGVDTERFTPVTSTKKQVLRAKLSLTNAPTAIFTGRLAPEKRVDAIIDVWPQVRECVPNAQLLVVGGGSEETVLRSTAGAGIHFTGRVQDVVPYLQASDVFVLPSKAEGLSNAHLEAMAVGLPTIVTNVGGAPDLIDHQQSGWLLDDPIEERLAEALTAILGNPARGEHMGQLGREIILKDYQLQLTVDRLYQLYHQLANAPD